MDRQQIFEKLKTTMVETFDLDPDKITMQAHLIDDLDLDSIDAIDLAVRLQEMTGERVAEETLKSIRTVADVVKLVGEMTSRTSSAG